MITLRLFKTAHPFHEIDSRILHAGAITLGRDASADWRIDDPRGDISRRHCTIAISANVIYLRDHSANGVTMGAERRRLPREADCEVRPGDSLHIGEYFLLVDQERTEDLEATQTFAPIDDVSMLEKVSAYPTTDAGLVEAFCEGAGLDHSSFIGDDPTALMRRLGAVYRQVVDDLGLLLGDRAALKNTLQLDRTTISARDNNPLKWAAPERVAVDLLRDRDTGFLKGAEALRASFEDLRRHNASVEAGSSAATEFVLRELSAAAFENGQQNVQALGFRSRSDGQWKAYQARHKALVADLVLGGAGEIAAAARGAYQNRLASLEEEAGA